MAGYSIEKVFQAKRDNARRAKINFDAIIEKYSKEFIDDDTVDVIENVIVAEKGFIRKSSKKSFGTTRLKTTKRKEESQAAYISGSESDCSYQTTNYGNIYKEEIFDETSPDIIQDLVNSFVQDPGYDPSDAETISSGSSSSSGITDDEDSLSEEDEACPTPIIIKDEPEDSHDNPLNPNRWYSLSRYNNYNPRETINFSNGLPVLPQSRPTPTKISIVTPEVIQDECYYQEPNTVKPTAQCHEAPCQEAQFHIEAQCHKAQCHGAQCHGHEVQCHDTNNSVSNDPHPPSLSARKRVPFTTLHQYGPEQSNTTVTINSPRSDFASESSANDVTIIPTTDDSGDCFVVLSDNSMCIDQQPSSPIAYLNQNKNNNESSEFSSSALQSPHTYTNGKEKSSGTPRRKLKPKKSFRQSRFRTFSNEDLQMFFASDDPAVAEKIISPPDSTKSDAAGKAMSFDLPTENRKLSKSLSILAMFNQIKSKKSPEKETGSRPIKKTHVPNSPLQSLDLSPSSHLATLRLRESPSHGAVIQKPAACVNDLQATGRRQRSGRQFRSTVALSDLQKTGSLTQGTTNGASFNDFQRLQESHVRQSAPPLTSENLRIFNEMNNSTCDLMLSPKRGSSSRSLSSVMILSPERPQSIPVQKGLMQERPQSTSVQKGLTQERPQSTPVHKGLAQERPRSIPVHKDLTQERPQSNPVHNGLTQERPQSIPVQKGLTQERPQSTPVQKDLTQGRPQSTPVHKGLTQGRPQSTPPVQKNVTHVTVNHTIDLTKSPRRASSTTPLLRRLFNTADRPTDSREEAQTPERSSSKLQNAPARNKFGVVTDKVDLDRVHKTGLAVESIHLGKSPQPEVANLTLFENLFQNISNSKQLKAKSFDSPQGTRKSSQSEMPMTSFSVMQPILHQTRTVSSPSLQKSQSSSESLQQKGHMFQSTTESLQQNGHQFQNTTESLQQNGHQFQSTTESLQQNGHQFQSTTESLQQNGHQFQSTTESLLQKGHKLQSTRESLLQKGHKFHNRFTTESFGQKNTRESLQQKSHEFQSTTESIRPAKSTLPMTTQNRNTQPQCVNVPRALSDFNIQMAESFGQISVNQPGLIPNQFSSMKSLSSDSSTVNIHMPATNNDVFLPRSNARPMTSATTSLQSNPACNSSALRISKRRQSKSLEFEGSTLQNNLNTSPNKERRMNQQNQDGFVIPQAINIIKPIPKVNSQCGNIVKPIPRGSQVRRRAPSKAMDTTVVSQNKETICDWQSDSSENSGHFQRPIPKFFGISSANSISPQPVNFIFETSTPRKTHYIQPPSNVLNDSMSTISSELPNFADFQNG